MTVTSDRQAIPGGKMSMTMQDGAVDAGLLHPADRILDQIGCGEMGRRRRPLAPKVDLGVDDMWPATFDVGEPPVRFDERDVETELRPNR
jgi:hypothetical protein